MATSGYCDDHDTYFDLSHECPACKGMKKDDVADNAQGRTNMEKPTQDEVNEYLNELRDLGVTNMYGAPRYVSQQFSISKDEALDMWEAWIKTFEEE